MAKSELQSYRDVDVKSKRCCDGVNKTIHVIANEPSLGLYRIQQHVRKTIPKLSHCESLILNSHKGLSGAVYDSQASVAVVKEITDSMSKFENMEQLLKKASHSAALINMKVRPPVNLIKF